MNCGRRCSSSRNWAGIVRRISLPMYSQFVVCHADFLLCGKKEFILDCFLVVDDVDVDDSFILVHVNIFRVTSKFIIYILFCCIFYVFCVSTY